ncbi:MAG TPA: MFS transporter [Spirochaetota bacterium]|nr:MFS transporter [Spirochaetota bacterium]
MQTDPKIKKVALIISAISAFLTPFMGSAINIVLPSIGKDFNLNAVEMGWVVTSYILSSAIFLVPFGRLSDIMGRKKIFYAGILLFTLFTLLIAVIPANSTLLITIRFIQGIGSAMIFGTGMTIIVSVYPPAERGRALGINVASVYLGLAVGPFLGGFFTQHFTWRSVFIATALIGLFLIIYIPLKLKGEWADARGEKFDISGSIIYGISLVSLMFGFSKLPTWTGFILITSGVLLFIIFAFYESRIEHPVLNFSIFRSSKTYTLATTSALINYSATFGVGFLMSLYLQNVKNLSPFQAGTVMLAQPVIQTFFSPIAGKLADRKEPQSIASAGMGITAIGLTMLTFIGRDTGIPFIAATLAVLGFGFAFFSSPNTTAAMNSADKRYYGVASSILGTMRLLGQMFSMGISMIVFTIIMKDAKITKTNSELFLKSTMIIFIIFAVLCFAGIFLKTRGATENRKKGI